VADHSQGGFEGVAQSLGPAVNAVVYRECAVHVHQIAQPAHHPVFAAGGPRLDNSLIVEQDRADAITHAQHSPGGHGGYLGGYHRFHHFAAAEEHGQALVRHHHNRSIALLGIDADVGFAGTVGDPPVHGADVVTGPVMAQLIEVQTAAAQLGSFAPCQQGAHRLLRQVAEAAGGIAQAHQLRKAGVDSFSTGIGHGSAHGHLGDDLVDDLVRRDPVCQGVVAQYQAMAQHGVQH